VDDAAVVEVAGIVHRLECRDRVTELVHVDLEGEGGRARALDALVPLAAMLPGLPTVMLTPDGAVCAIHGRDLGTSDFSTGRAGRAGFTRLVDPSGNLLGIAEPTGAQGFLHPAVVLV
jgi:hypothetical protein